MGYAREKAARLEDQGRLVDALKEVANGRQWFVMPAASHAPDPDACPKCGWIPVRNPVNGEWDKPHWYLYQSEIDEVTVTCGRCGYAQNHYPLDATRPKVNPDKPS